MPRYTTIVVVLLGTAPGLARASEGPEVSKYDGMRQLLVPAGAFTMGADDADAHGRTAEFPPHRVHLDAYWIDQHEVTNEQYAAFLNKAVKDNVELAYRYVDVGNPVCRIEHDAKAGVWRVEAGYERHPVLAVSWSGAAAYARAVRRRLPTEAEWERAARGVDGRRYPWGGQWDPKRANTSEAGPGRPTPVGAVAGDRSTCGAWDMAGNASEWVQDVWSAGFYMTSPVRNPKAGGVRRRGVARGGAWCLTEWDSRATSRKRLLPSAQRRYMGFRCAQTVPPPLPPAVKVGADVLFYAPLDGGVHAAAARGERRALSAPSGAGLQFVPGRRGQALVVGDRAGGCLSVVYDTADNFRVEQGTVAMWIQLRGWSGADEGFRYFFMIRDVTTCKFYVYRFGSGGLLVLAGNGVEGQWGSIGKPIKEWKDGQWVHLAVTWENRTVTLYVDGKKAGRTVVPPDRWFRGLAPAFSLGLDHTWSPKRKKAQTAIDEFVIFGRALSAGEIVMERDRTTAP